MLGDHPPRRRGIATPEPRWREVARRWATDWPSPKRPPLPPLAPLSLKEQEVKRQLGWRPCGMEAPPLLSDFSDLSAFVRD